MKINSPEQFEAYFRDLFKRIKDGDLPRIFPIEKRVKTMLYGEHTQVLQHSRSETVYPLLYVEFPHYSPLFEKQGILFGAFSVLINTQNSDIKAQNDAINLAYDIGRRIFQQMECDSREFVRKAGTGEVPTKDAWIFRVGGIGMDTGRETATPLTYENIDGCFGYRFTFGLRTTFECFC